MHSYFTHLTSHMCWRAGARGDENTDTIRENNIRVGFTWTAEFIDSLLKMSTLNFFQTKIKNKM